MDRLEELQGILNNSPSFNAHGQTYEIAGDLLLPDHARLSNINLIQLDQTVTRRSIYKEGGADVALENVVVNRGSDPTLGSIADSAGIWLSNVNGVTLKQVEATGHGKGTGIFLSGLVSPVLENLYVHDMRFSASANPGIEQLLGIWVNNCSRFNLISPRVDNIDSSIGNAIRPLQTDGISFSGCSQFSLFGPHVSNCGEGIDITGTVGNTRFSIMGGHITNIDSFGVKIANSASLGVIQGVTVTDAGYSAFVVSGAAQPNLPRNEHNQFIGCRAINTGSNGRWAAYNIVGFSIMQGNYDTSYPQNILFNSCLALDGQGSRTMKYGFRNENNSSTNKLVGNTTLGHTVAATLGTFGY